MKIQQVVALSIAVLLVGSALLVVALFETHSLDRTSSAAPGVIGPVGNEYDANVTTNISADLRLVADNLTAPIKLVSPPDGSGRLFIADQTGVVWIIAPDGKRLDQPFLNITDQLVTLSPGGDERGLLGLSFHPDFAINGKFYVYFTAPLDPRAPAGFDSTNHLAEFQVSKADPNATDMATERTVLMINKPQSNHNGGDIAFGPDGYLYVPTGDGGGGGDVGLGHSPIGNGQDLTTLLGKVLRIDVDQNITVNATATSDMPLGDSGYGIPSNNPLVGKSGRPEIWAWGFRNPWRMTFDQGGGHEMFVGNAGQNQWEGVFNVTKGNNYGWNIEENGHCYATPPLGSNASCAKRTGYMGELLIDPIISIPTSYSGNPSNVIIGGYVYRGTAVPQLDGGYVFGFFQKNNNVMLAKKVGSEWRWGLLPLTVESSAGATLPGTYLLSFGQDSSGEVYVLTEDDGGPSGHTGRVWKIVPSGGSMSMPLGIAALTPHRLSVTAGTPFSPLAVGVAPWMTTRLSGLPST